MQITVLTHRLESALAELERLRKVALKMGRSISWSTEDAEPIKHPERKGVLIDRTTITVEVDGGDNILQFDNARFVAKIEITDAGPMFYVAPNYGQDLPVELFESFQHKCDHCQHKRRRVRYYLVEKDGELLQVGSTCVKEFFGINPSHVLRTFEFFKLFRDMESEHWGSFGNMEYSFDVEQLSRIAAGVVMVDRCYRKPETRFNALDIICPPLYATSPEARKAHREMVEYYHENGFEGFRDGFDMNAFRVFVDNMTHSNYSANLKTILANGKVSSHQSKAILISGVYVYLRDADILFPKQKDEGRAALNEWVDAKVKARIEFPDVQVKGVHVCDGFYGTSYLYRMMDKGGRSLIWFATSRSEPLDKAVDDNTSVNLAGTIKKFDEREFKGTMYKQTHVNRVRILD